MFIDDLKSLIQRCEALELENRLLKKEIKRAHKLTKPKEKKSEAKAKTPSLFNEVSEQV